jgi:hypothetical protein
MITFLECGIARFFTPPIFRCEGFVGSENGLCLVRGKDTGCERAIVRIAQKPEISRCKHFSDDRPWSAFSLATIESRSNSFSAPIAFADHPLKILDDNLVDGQPRKVSTGKSKGFNFEGMLSIQPLNFRANRNSEGPRRSKWTQCPQTQMRPLRHGRQKRRQHRDIFIFQSSMAFDDAKLYLTGCQKSLKRLARLGGSRFNFRELLTIIMWSALAIHSPTKNFHVSKKMKPLTV